MQYINEHNYESVLIDFLEGRLTETQAEEVRAFLQIHTSIAREFDLLQSAEPLHQTDDIFGNKSLLKKTINDQYPSNSNYQEFIIARLEGDLTDRKEEELNLFLENNPEYRKDVILFSKTFLKPDEAIKYHYKKNLKKRTPAMRKRLLFLSYAAAAVMLLFLTLYLLPDRQVNRPAGIADNKVPATEKTDAVSTEKTTPAVEEKVMQKQQNKESEIKKKVVPEVKQHIKPKIKSGAATPKTIPESQQQEMKRSRIPMMRMNRIELARVEGGATEIQMQPVHSTYTILGNKGKNSPKDFLTLPQLATKEIKKTLYASNEPARSSEKLSIWDLAYAGIKGINSLTENDIKFDREYDEKGNVEAVAIRKGKFEVEAPVKK
ncbi:MAG TPA: hypothetical protein VE912_15340 [Bacteroidales bacterium]|nr:hypothetical protein [Bacteroidales bacterium]